MDAELNDLIRQTRVALREGAPGLEEFKNAFRHACDDFEAGRDQQGRDAVLAVVPHLRSFTQFFHGLLVASLVFLPESEFSQWQELGQRLASALGRFNAAWERGDMPAVCDLLRFDFCEQMDSLRAAFARFEQALPETATAVV